MTELQELRNEVLSLRNMGELTKQTESILLHKLNSIEKAINYIHCCMELKCGDCDCKIKYENIGCDTLKDCKKEW
tara:strand:+ start:98 stop:322 length:225 start_codon:yes stop_codon:yes gene_type:complete